MSDNHKFLAPGRLPFVHCLLRDLFMFRRSGMSWRAAWAAALDYWHYDRTYI